MEALRVEVAEGVVSANLGLAQFAAEHTVALTRFAYVLCGDRQRAQDLAQEAFVSLYRHFGELLPVGAPVAYARKTIVNAHLAAARKRSASERPVADVRDSLVAPFDPSERDVMWRALAGLPNRQRAVLVLRYYLDLSDRTIAELLTCRRGTVRSLAARAFATLRTDPTFTEERP